MIIIVDAGSTKTHVKVMGEAKVESEVLLPGINPFYQSSEEIKNLLENTSLKELTGKIDFVYHYGAGCANDEKKSIVARAWKQMFLSAKVEVESDMLAAVRALFSDEECGVACIIGTGSNSCQCEHGKITKNVPSLGFLLGDEGSGAYMGRLLVANMLKGIFNGPLVDLFYSEMKVDCQTIMDNVYRKGMPNSYLASFAPFIVAHKDLQEMQDIVNGAFGAFFERNVLQYSPKYPLGFVGSLSAIFSDNLHRIADEYGYSIKKIEKEPIVGLCDYHKTKKCIQ